MRPRAEWARPAASAVVAPTRRCRHLAQGIACLATVLALWGAFAVPDAAALPEEGVTAAVLAQDARFWQAFNHCNVAALPRFFTADVELYHDRNGFTMGREPLIASLGRNLCGNGPVRLRRAAVAGSVRVFPLRNGDTVYGAVMSGEHEFFVSEPGKPERLDGRALFTHLWLLREGRWKMARILSYSHGPAQGDGH